MERKHKTDKAYFLNTFYMKKNKTPYLFNPLRSFLPLSVECTFSLIQICVCVCVGGTCHGVRNSINVFTTVQPHRKEEQENMFPGVFPGSLQVPERRESTKQNKDPRLEDISPPDPLESRNDGGLLQSTAKHGQTHSQKLCI